MILRVVNIILLLVAFGNLPYVYYNLLRLVVCGSSIYLGYQYSQSKNEKFSWAFYIQAVIYNPLIPMYLGRELWVIVNAISIALFLGTYVADKKTKSRKLIDD